MANIKKIYLYAVSLISLVVLVIGSIILINLGLQSWVFKKAGNADYYYAPRAACPAKIDQADAIRLPECSDPEYETKQRQAEEERKSGQRQREISRAISMIIVAAPIFYYHWKLARKET